MYGWRARLGILTPSANVVTEPEFKLMAPEGVTCHYQKFHFTGGGVEDLKKLEKMVPDAAEMISHAGPAAIAMCCTGGSFAGGYGYDKMMIQKMQERNGNLPTTTTSTAMIDAFNELGIKKVSMAVPYLEEVAMTEKRFIEDHGIQVTNMKWLNIPGALDNAAISNETFYHLAKEVDEQESDAVLISCVAVHTIGIIEALEYDLKKPVVTSNQVTMWKLLRLADINERIEGFGKLLSEH
ncbi:MAG: Asp/Glu racemase [Deltaproteobacteria bacterium]|nr:Asp/Glu racemase [Deltaproteobacteria bacterium]MBW1861836.1 Asp/Glu racemase [Deltaproteobacteria bacterium]